MKHLRHANPYPLSARPSAGRAANPRGRSYSGVVANPTGIRAAGDPASSTVFEGDYAPALWDALVPVFGRQVDYWLDGDDAQTSTITVIWKEGAEDEDASPGRYSHALVKHGDLERPPRLGDVILWNGTEYDVVRVDAYRYGVSTVVLQDRTGAI